MHATRTRLATLALVLSLGAVLPAAAETLNFKAELKGANEIPPNTSSGTGALTATFDTATKRLTWKATHSGTSGPVTAAHLHGPAGPAQNAGVAVPLNPAPGSFEGSATLTDAQATDLMNERYYANFHTEANKGGEIRGQLVK